MRIIWCVQTQERKKGWKWKEIFMTLILFVWCWIRICFLWENNLEEVFEHLNCTRKGLTSDGVQERLDLFGYNKLEEKKVRKARFSFRLLCPYFLFFHYCLFCLPHRLVLLLPYPAVGKQNTEVFRLYVESFIMGHGSCSHHGHCSCTWRGKYLWLQIFFLYLPIF